MNDSYDVILADPPWSFRVWAEDTGNGRSASAHYLTMITQDICNFKVPASKNCALFMWACWPTLPDAFQVISAWGFEYKTIAWVWAKLNKSSMGFFTGMGYYTRANTEPCLLAVRGTMPVAVHDIQALIVSPVRAHSQKPDDQYRKIEALYPGRSYLEMFSRKKRAGWHSFGNEIKSDIQIQGA
jgi:N6-adenosine-specific RNA methylase IME4